MSNPPSSPPSVPTKIVPASTHIRRQSIRHSIDFSPTTPHSVSHRQPHLSPSRTTHALSKPYFSATHYSILRILCSYSVLSRGDSDAWKKLLSKEKLPIPYTAYCIISCILFQLAGPILLCLPLNICRQDAYDLEMATVGLSIELGMGFTQQNTCVCVCGRA